MNERKAFFDAMTMAEDNAQKSGERYAVMYPLIANRGSGKELCHLVVPISAESALEPGERDEIAMWVYPDGRIEFVGTRGD